MVHLIALASAGVWEPVWQGTIDGSAMPEVALMGMDQSGHTAWLRIGSGTRSTTGLWQVDLDSKQIDGRWTAGATEATAFGALAPLVHNEELLQRWGIVQAYIAGRATWPLVSFGSEGPWFAWEHGTSSGGDGVTLAGPAGDVALGEGLSAVYRPRFHPSEPLVAYTGASANGSYQVVIQHLESGERDVVDGVSHADHLDWDAQGSLWVTGGGCVSVVFELEATAVACGDALTSRLSPDGKSVAVSDWSGDGPDATLVVGWFRTVDQRLLGRGSVVGGRNMLALRDDGLLVVGTAKGTALLRLNGGQVATLDGQLQGALHDYWVDGRTLMMGWNPAKRRAMVGWLDPEEVPGW